MVIVIVKHSDSVQKFLFLSLLIVKKKTGGKNIFIALFVLVDSSWKSIQFVTN